MGGNDQFEVLSANEVIEETLDLCREKLKGQGIHLKESLETSIHLKCQRTQISQLLTNLINNAADAVQLNKVTDTKPWIRIESFVQSGSEAIEIRVIDSGPGVPPALAQQVFEPFFTTKPIGQGTGLGLSISRSILQNHGGSLKLTTQDGHTCFSITLPCTQASPALKEAS